MAFLEPEGREKVRERLKDLAGPVRLVLFKEDMAESSVRAEGLLREVAELSDKLELKVYNRYLHDQEAAEYGIEEVPTLVLEGPAGNRVRLLGQLVGYEFAVFLAALKDTAAGRSDIGDQAKLKLDWVAQPARIRCFVTAACVHCPKVARTALRFAVAYPLVQAEIIDVDEFPALASQYEVDQVPKVVINDRVQFTGAAPEEVFARAVALAVQGEGRARKTLETEGEVFPQNPLAGQSI
ncbi:MAG: thioredoxin family protein [Elusimicrobia bacterium]|nr:thioredoxin family protein [Elusimicrobiota bacterium]